VRREGGGRREEGGGKEGGGRREGGVRRDLRKSLIHSSEKKNYLLSEISVGKVSPLRNIK
jgi:hypothetical protein